MKTNDIKKVVACLLCLCSLFGCAYMADMTVLARTLEEVQAEMDSALELPNTTYANKRDRAVSSEPEVRIDKTSKWLDIERGYAQIDLKEYDTKTYTNQGVDYLIILDRTRTMALNDTVFEGEPSGEVGSGNSPCLNREHYYEYQGQKVDLYDYENGITRETGQSVYIPLGTGPYNYHRNASGAHIAADYSNGCMDRLSIAKETICGLIDKIEANSASVETGKSRVSYWSFAGTYWPEKEGELDTDREKGLFDYIKLTNNYSSVKKKVQDTGSYAGTYYLESLKRAYEQLLARTGSNKDRPAKVIFISDGKCADDDQEILEWADKLRKIPNCTVFTLAVGMPVTSEGAVLLKNMSSNQNKTTFAAFTTNLNSSNPAFADTLAAIEEAGVEVKATDKVMTDKLHLEYWDFVEILSADGTASVTDGVLTWNIPKESEREYTCSIKVRLKEAYRFLLSDTRYPTNLDTETGKGCQLTYVVSGGASHGEVRTIEKETPYLPYGTVQVVGNKHFTVAGAEADSVSLTLSRSLSGGTPQELCKEIIDQSKGWSYSFKTRKEKEELLPLVLYTNEGKTWSYELREDADSYNQIDTSVLHKEGVLQVDFWNEPYKLKVRLEKVDKETGAPLTGAVFGVYAYNRESNTFEPYYGEDGSVKGNAPVKLQDKGNGMYESPGWFYFTPDNQGRFQIMEEMAPDGYVGDFSEENGTKKQVYDIVITKENTGTTVAVDAQGTPLKISNERVKGKIKLYKVDADSGLPIPQGSAALFYEDETKNAVYGLFTKDNKLAAEKRISAEGFLVFEDLELGSYYIKELDFAPEGYLINSEPIPVDLIYQGEHVPVIIQEINAPEPVKKQSQKIYKIGEGKLGEEYEWLTEAGFMVFPLTSLGDAVIGMNDEEILEYVDKHYKNPQTFTYESMKNLKAVTLYDEGKEYQLQEIHSENGTYITPPLPYGDYLVAETKVPDKKRPVEPFIIHVKEDENDKEITGDGEGTSREPLVLRDEEVLSRIRIYKMDGETKKPLAKGTAGYVIHDVDGAWKERFFNQATMLQKAEYLLKYDGLVVEYDEEQKKWTGSYEYPFMTKIIEGQGGKLLEAVTQEGLPTGTYELEEVMAPEGYVLQGYEGRIATKEDRLLKDTESFVYAENGTYYETRTKAKWMKTPSEAITFSVGIGIGHYDQENDCWWTDVYQENVPIIGKISLLAEQEIYETHANGRRTGRKIWSPMVNEKFILYAKGDIFTSEGKLVYKSGEKIQELTTGSQGTAWTGEVNNVNGMPKGLWPGEYRLVWIAKETEQIKEERIITLTCQDNRTPVVYRDEVFRIPMKKSSKSVILENPETGDHQPLAVYLMLACASLGCGAFFAFKRRKRA